MNYQETVHANFDHFDRVRKMTPRRVNEHIDHKAEATIEQAKQQGRAAILARLDKIDREWDIDRLLMLNFSVIVFAQLVAARKNRKWLWGPLIQTPLLFLHATVGWCPPMLALRPMGFRTRKEIQAEREALLASLESPTVQ